MSDLDLYDVAKGFAYAADGIDSINKSKTRNELSAQNKEDRAEEKQTEADINTNMGVMASPLQAHQTAMVGTPTSQAEARRRTAIDTQAKETIQGYNDNEEYKKKANDIIQWRMANKEAEWDKMPPKLSAGFQGKKAQAFLINQEATTEEGRTRIMKARIPRIKAAYDQFTNSKNHINAALQQGDLETVVNGIQQMTKKLPLPYEVGDFDQNSQTFSIKYLDRTSGEFQESGRIGIQEALAQINQTGEKQFFTQIANSAETIRKQNVENRMTPEYAVRKSDGQRFVINRQKDPLDPRQVYIEVSDEKTGEMFIIDSESAMNEMGIFAENLPREKALKGMDVQDAQINSHNRANQPGPGAAQKQQTAADDKTIEMAVKFFGEGEMSLMNSFSNKAEAGKAEADNLHTKMLKYMDGKDPNTLKGAELQKYQIAQAGVIAVTRRFGLKGPKAAKPTQPGGDAVPYTGDKPPSQNAKRDKKGAWWEKTGEGWQPVTTAGVIEEQSATPPPVNPDPEAGPQDEPGPGEQTAIEGGEEESPVVKNQPIRPELPQDMSQWNVQVISQRGRQVQAVITDRGPIPLTPEEVEQYKVFSSGQQRKALGAGVDWFKQNMTGTQQITQ